MSAAETCSCSGTNRDPYPFFNFRRESCRYEFALCLPFYLKSRGWYYRDRTGKNQRNYIESRQSDYASKTGPFILCLILSVDSHR